MKGTVEKRRVALQRFRYEGKIVVAAFVTAELPLVVVALLAGVGLWWVAVASLLGLVLLSYAVLRLTRPVRYAVVAMEGQREKAGNDDASGPASLDLTERLVAETERMLDGLVSSARESLTDPLTGAFNRRYSRSRLDGDIARARRQSIPLSVLFLDLDAFKAINDAYGHQVGDDCLRHVVNVVRAHVREGDWVVRWGGDEFLIVLWQAGQAEATTISKRIQAALRSEPAQCRECTVPVTASIGVAEVADGEASESLFTRVDRELYRAKGAVPTV